MYLISAHPDESQANQYHPIAHEWFTLVEGKTLMLIEVIETEGRKEIVLDAEQPQTIFVPNNIAHTFKNISMESYILVIYTDKIYDPQDTVNYKF